MLLSSLGPKADPPQKPARLLRLIPKMSYGLRSATPLRTSLSTSSKASARREIPVDMTARLNQLANRLQVLVLTHPTKANFLLGIVERYVERALRE